MERRHHRLRPRASDGAYGLSFLFARAGGYDRLFDLGSAAIVFALLIDLIAARGRSGTRRAPARSS